MSYKIKSLFILLTLALFIPYKAISQTSKKNKSVLESAHEKKFVENEYIQTDHQLFNTKVYSVDSVATNRTHHWFFQLLDLEGKPLNYAEVELTGYLKNDPSIQFNYTYPVFKLCSEGKYIIGFVNVKNSGTWVLDISIDNFGIQDSIRHEIEI